MAEGYDIFRNLDEICNGNNVESFVLPSDDEIDDDFTLDIKISNAGKITKGKAGLIKKYTTSPQKLCKQAKATSQSMRAKDTNKLRFDAIYHSPNSPQQKNHVVARRTRSVSKALQILDLPPLVTIENIDTAQSKRTRKGRNGIRTKRNKYTSNSVDPSSVASQLIEQTSSRVRSNRDVHRARRNYIAEVAARSTTVDYVDLVSSPLPIIDGIVIVDSDDEKPISDAIAMSAKKFDVSFDEENPDISVKVIWNGKPEIFKLRKYQKFSAVFTELADREGEDVSKVILNLNNKIISLEDTPASIDYKIYQFINGRIVKRNLDKTTNSPKKRDQNNLQLKVQSDKWKKPIMVEINKYDTFKILYIKCAEELNIPFENIILSFDGDRLEYSTTTADFEFEGGEVIDLRFKE